MKARLWRPPRRLRRTAYAAVHGEIGPGFNADRSGIVSRFQIAWGNSPPNQLADGAGRHRRVAIGFGLLTIPLFVMAISLFIDGMFRTFAVAHVLMALSFPWVACDLIRSASMIGKRGLPHASLVALFVAATTLRITRPEKFVRDFGAVPFFFPGLLLLGLALVVLTLADRRPDPLVGVAGRLILVVGSTIVGLAELGRMVRGLFGHTLYSIGLLGAGVLLLGMALFEGRLLWRGLALARSERPRL